MFHAAGESSPGGLSSGTHAVLLQARDEEHLKQIGFELFMAGIPHKLIFEPDAPWTGQLMAIGVCPTHRTKKIKRAFANLPLLKERIVP